MRFPMSGPGAVIAIQSFGDFLGFHPHAHVLVTDGCFYVEGAFRVNSAPNPKDLEDLFRYEVFKVRQRSCRTCKAIQEHLVPVLMHVLHEPVSHKIHIRPCKPENLTPATSKVQKSKQHPLVLTLCLLICM
jgi:hypothetical protein